MKIVKITDSDLKGEICNSILRQLPLWFGIESAIIDYVGDCKTMDTWVIYHGHDAIGFLSINRHFPTAAEIHVMGILEKYHRQGLGYQLVQVVEKELANQGVQFFTVKTLSPSRPNREYEQTRNFYLKAGFVPIEEFKTLWNEHNPCLFLAKSISAIRTP